MKKYFLYLIYICFFLTLIPVHCFADSVEGVYSAANEYFEKGLFAEAEAEYKKIIKTQPGYAPAYNNLGIITSMDKAKTKESVLYFLKAATVDPSYASPYRNLGIICYKINELDRAVAYFKKAIELDSGNYKDFFNLGWIFLVGLNKAELSIDFFKKATELKSDYPDPYYGLGMAYIALGKKSHVFDQITELRLLRREDLASALEDFIRPSATDTPKDMTKNLYVDTEYSFEEKETQDQLSESKGVITGNAVISIKLKGITGSDSKE